MTDGPPMAGEAVLFTRAGCPLCFALERLAQRSARRHGLPLRVVDVDSHPALVERYGNEVPVLELPGGVFLRGRVEAEAVEGAFRRAVAATVRGGRDSAPGSGASRS